MPDEPLMTGDAARICGVVPDTIRPWNRECAILIVEKLILIGVSCHEVYEGRFIHGLAM